MKWTFYIAAYLVMAMTSTWVISIDC